MPFPDINSNLALNAHMYICHNILGNEHHFIKCQTLKPYMLSSRVMKHYWDEEPNIQRNPFSRLTRIDCDKEFVTKNILYHDCMRTTLRPDVCSDVMSNVERELLSDGYDIHSINTYELLLLNNALQDGKHV